MRSSLLLAVAALAISAAAGCNNRICASSFDSAPGTPSSGSPQRNPTQNAGDVAPTDAARTVSEADIVQLDHEQNRIYAMTKSGSLAVVDASQASRLTLLGKTMLSGVPFEMYRRGDILVTMANQGLSADGTVRAPLSETADPAAWDLDASALISSVDVADPAHAKTLSSFKVPGEIADSRVVGDVLYLVTYENGHCYGCETNQQRTLVTTFDIKAPATPKVIDQLIFKSASYNPSSLLWKRTVIATDQRLYVGGAADVIGNTGEEGSIEVIDITDPTGHLARGAMVTTPGPIMNRWQMDEHEGFLRVISQRGVSHTPNGLAFPDIDTFRIDSTSSFVHLGHTTMKLPRQEGLKTVRFDGTRAYAITFNQTDPLFTLDLSDAANPVQKGELELPGWIYHLEPRGNRLIGLGLDRRDSSGSLNVTLFDVSDLAKPTQLGRVSFGPQYVYSDAQITSGVMAEDQDRIQKAFRIFDDGLIAVPFSGWDPNYYGNGSSCAANGGGVQLLQFTQTSLVKQALLPVTGNARRAIRRDSEQLKELIAVSDSNVRSFSINDRTTAQVTADVVIGACVARPSSTGGGRFNDDGMLGGGRGGDVSMGGWGGSTCE